MYNKGWSRGLNERADLWIALYQMARMHNLLLMHSGVDCAALTANCRYCHADFTMLAWCQQVRNLLQVAKSAAPAGLHA